MPPVTMRVFLKGNTELFWQLFHLVSLFGTHFGGVLQKVVLATLPFRLFFLKDNKGHCCEKKRCKEPCFAGSISIGFLFLTAPGLQLNPPYGVRPQAETLELLAMQQDAEGWAGEWKATCGLVVSPKLSRSHTFLQMIF